MPKKVRVEGTCYKCGNKVELYTRPWEAPLLQGTNMAICEVCDETGLTSWRRIKRKEVIKDV